MKAKKKSSGTATAPADWSELEALAYKARAKQAMADVVATLAPTGDVECLKQHSLSTFLLDLKERSDDLVSGLEKLQEEQERASRDARATCFRFLRADPAVNWIRPA